MKGISIRNTGLAFFLLLIAGCKVKDKIQETAVISADKKESIDWLLAGDDFKAWTVESFSINGEDKLKDMKPCQLDNVDCYYRNQIYESREGNSRCNESDPELISRGKWTLNADSTAIDVKLGSRIHTLQIISLTKNKLHYRSSVNKQTTEAVLVATDYMPVNTEKKDTNR